ncbi:50S ribosomal protein L1 [Patescibacteria group bacterium]
MTIDKAISQVKNRTKSKFDATVEVHINLNVDSKKQDQMVRFSTVLPHGTGKSKVVATMASKDIPNADINLTEADIGKIEKGTLKPGRDFDVIVTEPKFMSKIAGVAKILGPAGVMPNPKNGTVTEDVKKAVENFKKGQVEIRTEQLVPIIHTIIGKVSFKEEELVENFNGLIKALEQNKPQGAGPDFIKTVFVCSTMGKSIQVDL